LERTRGRCAASAPISTTQIDDLSEPPLTDYFTDLLESHSWSAVKLDLYGLKFFYAHVLHKPWVNVNLVKPPKAQRLPDIVTVEQAGRWFAATRIRSYRVFYFTAYSLGLRLGEGLRLQVGDIDAARQRVPIRDAKGNKDRLVPLPEVTRDLLRRFWQVHRNPVLLFPNRHGGLKGACSAACGIKKDHSAQPASQLRNPFDRSGCGSARDPRPSLDPDHGEVHPSDIRYAAQRTAGHQRADEWLLHPLGDSPMILLSSIIQRFEAELLAQYHNSLLPSHRKALAAMKDCRTSASPLMQAQCTECDQQILVPHSCGQRSCPHCQHHESQQWIECQLQKLVPGPYFPLTFTLPAALRALAFSAQRTLYTLMTQCACKPCTASAKTTNNCREPPGPSRSCTPTRADSITTPLCT
jgi:integrase/recombinase XerD